MQTYLVIGGGLVLLVGILVVTNFRLIQTLYLITQTTPYTQSGTDAGNILIIGDSTGYGTGVKNPKDSIAGRIGSDFPKHRIENQSHNGDTIAAATNRIDEIDQSYELILLQLGANDIIQKRAIPDIVSDLAVLYEQIVVHTDQIVMMSLGDVGAVPAFTGDLAKTYSQQSAAYHTALAQFAAQRANFTYVNLYEDPATDPFVQEPAVYIAADGLHPSAAGYATWYTKLYPILTNILSGTRTTQ